MLSALGQRVAWWGGLSLAAWGGHDLLDAFASDDAFASTTWRLSVAFVLATLVMLTTRARHLRIGSLLLAFVSGSLALLSWYLRSA